MMTKHVAALGAAAAILLSAGAVAADCASQAAAACAEFQVNPADPTGYEGQNPAYAACVSNYMRACEIEYEPADPNP
ncbi:hypothetical protein [Brevundimonas sp.]|uniref:hypothetical protein n=1 Tax=Brevundimonas sp. TaxID=1871086 RepID=UPI002ED8156E